MSAYTPLPFTAVAVSDAFWATRLRVNRERTLPIEYQQIKETGRIDAFRLDWQPGQSAPPHIFWDSDVAKWIEACSYSLATHPDPALDAQLDQVIELIASAQQPDGYLNVHFTVVEPEKRWSNLRDWHELYCAGHLIEAAVAHFQATGKHKLLDVLCRYADTIDQVFGPGEGQKQGYPGHEEIELALVKLAQVTGAQRYDRLARYFVDQRGAQPHYYDAEALARGENPASFWGGRGQPLEKRYAYMQAHLPVRQQREVTGHAVRAMYLYSAMADMAASDASLRPALEALWQDVCTRKLYLTGGIGPSRHNEGFTHPYDLPDESAYAETCAAIGLVFWNHRLLQLDCDRRYADVMERALYNGVLSGVSLDGEKFFYENPLASAGNHHRQAWFDCACCPPNLARLLASLGGYIYSFSENEAVVHLYIQSAGRFHLEGQEVTLHQETRYPWEGTVSISLEMAAPAFFGLKLRLPGWCQAYRLSINDTVCAAGGERFGSAGTASPAADPDLQDAGGYLCLTLTWRPGDVVNFEMDMPVERVYAHPEVRQAVGRVALQRGPVVYCFEQADQSVPVHQIVLPKSDARFTPSFDPDLLGGVTVLTGTALVADSSAWGSELYRSRPPAFQPCTVKAVPYYAWDNRQPGAMRVWLPELSGG